MARAKKSYDNKYKVTRILLADYLLLKELAQIAGFSMSEALHELIEHTQSALVIPRSQIPMPALSLRAKPTLSVNGQAATHTALSLRAKPALSVNGQAAKHTALSIKPKGGKNE